jgi:two-component system response regulator DevR
MVELRVALLVVDDDWVVRAGVEAALGTVPHFLVVGEAGSVAAAVVEARRCRPDVVLMDVRLPDGSGVEACREIRSELPHTRVLMLTAYADEDVLVASILAGASGYLLKQSPVDRLIEAVELVAHGGSLLDPAVTTTLLERMRRLSGHAPADPLATLSEQERKVLRHIAAGKTNRQIAATLDLSEHTVRTYVSNILRKLHLPRRAQAAAFIAKHQSQTDF